VQVGIISDTHGLLRLEATRALAGVDLIVHAGDVGKAEVLARLKEIAPVFAVRGNVDTEEWARELPETAVVDAGPACFYVLHNLQELDLVPEVLGFRAVISGHTHKPEQSEKNGVLYLNPGSAGPRRFRLPVTLALVEVEAKPWQVQIIELM
jgi:putative phosphoesterase